MPAADGELRQRLLVLFQVEAEERLTAMSRALRSLRGSEAPQERAAAIEVVFREAHSLKGAARAVDLGTVEALCQAIEEVVAALKAKRLQPDADLVELLQRSADAVGGVLARDEPGGVDALVRELEGVAARASLHAPAGAASEGPRAAGAPAIQARHAGAPTHQPPGRRQQAQAVVRVASAKLESVVRHVDELLGPRLASARRAAEVDELVAAIVEHGRRFRRVGAAVPQLERLVEAAPAGDDGLEALVEYLQGEHEAHRRLEAMAAALKRQMDGDRRQLDALVGALRAQVREIQLLPCLSLLEPFERLVRELAREQGKDAELVIEGRDVQVDRRLLEALRDPLTHMIRNAIDHGLEAPAERRAAGKPPRGTITVAVAQPSGGMVELSVHDDGRGVDTERLRAAAGASDAAADGRSLEGEALLDVIFRSGVTTSGTVTGLSGRGLGLAIARDTVERLGGTIVAESTVGAGMTFRIALPASVATVQAVVVRVGAWSYAVPVAHVVRVVGMAAAHVRTIGSQSFVTVAGASLPLRRLADVLELEPADPTEPAPDRWMLVLGRNGGTVAVEVDEIVDQLEVLVKPLGPQLPRVRHVAGATVLGDGRVIPILDGRDLLDSAGMPARAAAEAGAGATATPTVLVVEDSVTSRSLLTGIFESAGFRALAAVDGRDALERLRAHGVDVVVSDVDMPHLDGLELTARLRADAALARLPVVLVTSLDDDDHRRRAEQAGADAYLLKQSFDRDNLLDVVRDLLARRAEPAPWRP